MFFKNDKDMLEPKINIFDEERPKVYKKLFITLIIFFLTISLAYQYFQNMYKKENIKLLIKENDYHRKKKKNFEKLKIENIKLRRENEKLKKLIIKSKKVKFI